MKPKRLSEMSHEEFAKMFNEYGRLARMWNRRFAGLIPEAQRRGLHEKSGCASVTELASKTGSLNWQQVRTVLTTDKQLSDKPKLRKLLEDGAVAPSKLSIVASLATKKTDEKWAERAKGLSWKALQELKSEVQKQQSLAPEDMMAREMGYAPRPEFIESKERMVDLHFDALVAERFLAFREDYASRKRKSVSMSSALGTLMDGYSDETQNPPRFEQVLYVDKERSLYLTPTRWGLVKLTEEDKKKYNEKGPVRDLNTLLARANEAAAKSNSRHLPEAIKAFVRAKFGGFCAFPGCHRRGKIFHHLYRYALVQKHDPEKIAFLCKNHEELAHAGLIDNELQSATKWKVRLARKIETRDDAARARIDAKVSKFRSPKSGR